MKARAAGHLKAPLTIWHQLALRVRLKLLRRQEAEELKQHHKPEALGQEWELVSLNRGAMTASGADSVHNFSPVLVPFGQHNCCLARSSPRTS